MFPPLSFSLFTSLYSSTQIHLLPICDCNVAFILGVRFLLHLFNRLFNVPLAFTVAILIILCNLMWKRIVACIGSLSLRRSERKRKEKVLKGFSDTNWNGFLYKNVNGKIFILSIFIFITSERWNVEKSNNESLLKDFRKWRENRSIKVSIELNGR